MAGQSTIMQHKLGFSRAEEDRKENTVIHGKKISSLFSRIKNHPVTQTATNNASRSVPNREPTNHYIVKCK